MWYRENVPSGSLVVEGPPHGITLFAYAAISADMAEGDAPAEKVLEGHALTMAQFTESSVFWTRRMGEDPRVTAAFSDAFTKAQDAKKPLVTLSVEEWAALAAAIEDAGAPQPPLAARKLSTADYMRLVRHWAKALGADPNLARAHEAAMARIREGV
jgi:hypothetical protein